MSAHCSGLFLRLEANYIFGHRFRTVRNTKSTNLFCRIQARPLQRDPYPAPESFPFCFCGNGKKRTFVIPAVCAAGESHIRRGAGVAELARLESVCALTRTVGSNPTLSAPHTIQPGIIDFGLFSLIPIHSNRLNPLEFTACWMFFLTIYCNSIIFIVCNCPSSTRL